MHCYRWIDIVKKGKKYGWQQVDRGIIAVAVVIFLLGIGTLLGGKELNTTCSGDASCSTCGGDVEKCENN